MAVEDSREGLAPTESSQDGVVATDIVGGSRRPEKDALKVFVGGLPFSAAKSDVRTHFEECGHIDWLHMPLDTQGRSQGIAFISYWEKDSVDRALELDGSNFAGRTLKVNMATAKPVKAATKQNKNVTIPVNDATQARSTEAHSAHASQGDLTAREVFVGSIPFNCSQEVLRKDFSECGEIQKISMPMHDEGKSRGVAFITFATKEGVAEALKFNGTQYGKCNLVVRLSSEKVERSTKLISRKKKKGITQRSKVVGGEDKGDRELNPLEVIVKGLPFKAKETALKERLCECGDMEAFRMPLNRKGQCLGFAFAAFQTKRGLKKALKLNGTEFDGRAIAVEQTVGPANGQDREGGSAVLGRGEPESPGKKARQLGRGDGSTTPVDDKMGRRRDDSKGGGGEISETVPLVEMGPDGEKRRDSKEKRKRCPEDISKEELIARTKENREERKKKREQQAR